MSGTGREIRILIYGEYFLPIVGGVQTSINLLARGLMGLNSDEQRSDAANRISVTVVTRTAANGMDDSTLPYEVTRCPSLRQLRDLISRADVVHLAGPCLLPMVIAWIIRKPFVIEHHGYQSICPNGLLFREPERALCPGYFRQKRYDRCLRCASTTMGTLGAWRSLFLMIPRLWLSKRARLNLTITDHVAKRLELPRSQTIYYGIDVVPVAAVAPASSQLPVRVAYVGRLVPEKGLPVLMQAAKSLSDRRVSFRLTFIGDGAERTNLEATAGRLGIEHIVNFTGDLRGADLNREVSEVGIVVMPSVWEETAGLSAIEQMMRGRVVVAADIGGLAEVVGDGGLKFPPGDHEALANCVQRVIEDPALARSLGAAARERAMQLFRLDQMIESHVAAYEALAGILFRA